MVVPEFFSEEALTAREKERQRDIERRYDLIAMALGSDNASDVMNLMLMYPELVDSILLQMGDSRVRKRKRLKSAKRA